MSRFLKFTLALTALTISTPLSFASPGRDVTQEVRRPAAKPHRLSSKDQTKRTKLIKIRDELKPLLDPNLITLFREQRYSMTELNHFHALTQEFGRITHSKRFKVLVDNSLALSEKMVPALQHLVQMGMTFGEHSPQAQGALTTMMSLNEGIVKSLQESVRFIHKYVGKLEREAVKPATQPKAGPGPLQPQAAPAGPVAKPVARQADVALKTNPIPKKPSPSDRLKAISKSLKKYARADLSSSSTRAHLKKKFDEARKLLRPTSSRLAQLDKIYAARRIFLKEDEKIQKEIKRIDAQARQAREEFARFSRKAPGFFPTLPHQVEGLTQQKDLLAAAHKKDYRKKREQFYRDAIAVLAAK